VAPGDGLVDRAWPEVKLLLEVDGRVWHSREQAMARDRARDRAAAAAGWQTLRVLEDEVAEVPHLVRSEVVSAYQVRRSQLAG
jgi:very-short-patch-repair endonuclease